VLKSHFISRFSVDKVLTLPAGSILFEMEYVFKSFSSFVFWPIYAILFV